MAQAKGKKQEREGAAEPDALVYRLLLGRSPRLLAEIASELNQACPGWKDGFGKADF